MLNKPLKEDKTFNVCKRESLSMYKKICEECTVCIKYGRTSSKPTVGLPLEENFNQVIAIDLGELDGENFWE